MAEILGNKQEQQSTPFHLTQQQSISEIAPDTQRSHNGMIHMRSSFENIYGLIEEGGVTGDHMMVRVPAHLGEDTSQSSRSYYNQRQQLTNLINPVNINSTTEFYPDDAYTQGTTGRLEGLTNDFEDHASQPFEINHRRGMSSNINMIDQMIMQHNNQILPSTQYRGISYFYKDDESQRFDTNMTQYIDDNDAGEENSQSYGGVNLLVWGRNQMGQLGIEPQQHSVIKFPMVIPGLDRIFGRSGAEVKQVSCGKAHTLLLVERSGHNFLYSMGTNKQGQLGIGKNVSMSIDPVLISDSLCFTKLACSKNSSFGQTDEGTLYSWGSNKEGILGLDTQSTDQYSPYLVSFDDSLVIAVQAGKNHACAIVRERSAIISDEYENTLYSWGSNKYGQLGHGTYQSSSKPVEVVIKQNGSGDESGDMLTVSVKDQQPVMLSCGDAFTTVQTQSGLLYSCGSNIQGQLGLGDNSSSKVNRLTKLSFQVNEMEIEKLVSSDFTACLLRNGDLYIWGPTPIGQYNSPKNIQELYRPKDQDRMVVRDISIGSSFGLIQDSKLQCIQLGSLFHEQSRQQYDSQASGAMAINISQNITLLKGGPLSLDCFACGHDFVVASTTSQPEQVRRFIYHNNQSSRKGNINTSRSVGYVGGRKSQLIDTTQQEISFIRQNQPIYGGPYPNVGGGRYGQNPQQQSVCSSLSPLRTSFIQNESRGRNDFINRSAIINGQTQSKQLESLKILRDSVTPLKEFIPPLNQDQSFQKQPGFHQEQKHQESTQEDAFPQLSHYSTVQDDRHHQTNSAYNTAHMIHAPSTPSVMSKQHTPYNQIVPTLQLTSSMNSNKLQQMSQRGGIEYIDILIKEKQELQHSLNIEIQKRLMAEREATGSEDKLKLNKQIELLRGELDKARQERRDAINERDQVIEKNKQMESELMQSRNEMESVNDKLETVQAENEMLKVQLVQSMNQSEQAKKDLTAIEETLQKKAKEIYDLTVQLGCLKEENHQYKSEHDDIRIAFEDRLKEVKERAESDYHQLMDDYQTFQTHCKIEADTVDAMRRQNEEQATKIKEQDDKIKKLQSMNDKLRVASRQKRASQFKLEQPTANPQVENIEPAPLSSHYTSVGFENKKPQSQEHSFHSLASKKSKVTKVNKNKENDNIIIAPLMKQEIEQTLEVRVEEEKILKKKPQHQQLVANHNLFKKQHQPVLSQSMMVNEQHSSNRQNTNRDQGCLQVPITRKKSAGVPSQVKQTLTAGILKANNSRINQLNQPAQVKTLNPKEKTPTRPLTRSDLSHQQLLQPRTGQSRVQKSFLTVNPSHQASYHNKSPTLSAKPVVSTKIKSISNPPQQQPSVTQSQIFHLNPNEDSIFDPRLTNQLDDQTLKKRRTSQQSASNFTLIQRNPQQEVTLGGSPSSSPSTPQIAPTAMMHQDKPSYVLRSLESPTPKHNLFTEQDAMRKSQQLLVQKNASISSTSTNNGQHAQIMSEMRNKLIDIQNNKQYIEQKIQEYEKKLLQLKGTSSSLVLSQQAYCDMPRQYSQLQKSGSGMIMPLSSNRSGIK